MFKHHNMGEYIRVFDRGIGCLMCHWTDDILSRGTTAAWRGIPPSTISRTPLPLSVMSTTCCLTTGSRPLSWYCNCYKAHRQTAIAPFLGYTVPLFHPQQQQREEHFAWSADATVIIDLTSTGQVTIEVLRTNRPHCFAYIVCGSKWENTRRVCRTQNQLVRMLMTF